MSFLRLGLLVLTTFIFTLANDVSFAGSTDNEGGFLHAFNRTADALIEHGHRIGAERKRKRKREDLVSPHLIDISRFPKPSQDIDDFVGFGHDDDEDDVPNPPPWKKLKFSEPDSPEYRARKRERKARIDEKVDEVSNEIKGIKSAVSTDKTVMERHVRLLRKIPCAEIELKLDLDFVEKKLNEDCYGMEEVKRVIIQHLSKRDMSPGAKGKILGFVGPPGCGKTMISEIIAEGIGLPYKRVSLAGVCDSMSIRGTPRAYTSASEGIILEAICNAKRDGQSCANPVILLDELDKMAEKEGPNGSPANPLLAVTDYGQNSSVDNDYAGVGIDYSRVTFIATTNDREKLRRISEPLDNRIEWHEIKGYDTDQKVEIAERHILPKVVKDIKIPERFRRWRDWGNKGFGISRRLLKEIAEQYTGECGVRQLEMRIERLLDHYAYELRKDPERYHNGPPEITEEVIRDIFKADRIGKNVIGEVWEPRVGCVNIMYATGAGGGIGKLEARITNRRKQDREPYKLIGTVGDTTKESLKAVYSYVAANVDKSHRNGGWGLCTRAGDKFEDKLIEIYFAGLGQKSDGPSAGLAEVVAIYSALTNKVPDSYSSITGDIDFLSGDALPVGGVPEKIAGAKKVGITRIFLPESNYDDAMSVRAEILDGLTIVSVKNVNEILNQIFPQKLQKDCCRK
ncbi:AAA family ATPase [bacterium]|nr:AAA family ATPase [bacterium]